MASSAPYCDGQHPKETYSLVKFLISKGANPNLADKEGNTPLDIAVEIGLRGYREPGENVDNYRQVIDFLKPLTGSPIRRDSTSDMAALVEGITELGIHARRRSQPHIEEITPTSPGPAPDNEYKGCTLL